jgi:lipid-A-disaccharide synthase
MVNKIFISAGDVSGDLHASFLVKEILKTNQNIQIIGLGGQYLKNTKISFLADTVSFEGFGLDGLVKKYFYFRKIFKHIVCPNILKEKPDVIILVDFYGFNIHIAKFAKQLGIKVIYYISPQIWASRYGRIKKIKKYVDKMLTIFPFEESIYKNENINVKYVGHPLLDIIGEIHKDKGKICNELNVMTDNELIGLMPGSRVSEVKQLLPIMLKIFSKVYLHKVQLIIFLADSIDKKIIEQMIDKCSFKEYIKIVSGPRYDIRKCLRFAIVSSGTVTVENTILGLPMIIMYKISKFSYFVAKIIVKIKFIGMPNILAKKEIVPEFVQNIDIEKIAKLADIWIYDLYNNPVEKVKEELLSVKNMLGDKGVIQRVVKEIL